MISYCGRRWCYLASSNVGPPGAVTVVVWVVGWRSRQGLCHAAARSYWRGFGAGASSSALTAVRRVHLRTRPCPGLCP
jgi:hypothetical protein